MCYVVFGGGKWMCLLLVYVSGWIFGVDEYVLDVLVVVVELIYVYLLVYDDLLVMDDDVLCCGCFIMYIVFDEVIVILVGDVLQICVFGLFVDVVLLVLLCVYCLQVLIYVFGVVGMCGGQVFDIDVIGYVQLLEVLQCMYVLKIGVLICVVVWMGVLCGDVLQIDLLQFDDFVNVFGLVFQVCDDVFDVEVSFEQFGKIVGKDQVQEKLMFFVLFGMEGVKVELVVFSVCMYDSLVGYDDCVDVLCVLGWLVVECNY